MKRILLTAAMLLMIVSCGRDQARKSLILYFSQTGTTEVVAHQLQEMLGADIEAIVPVVPYDGSYMETIERGRKEKDEGTFPEIQPLKADIRSYDVIFLGYPVWFGTYATPIETLLRTVDFKGKKVVPFCTFGSGGLDSSTKDIEAKLPDAKVLPGYGVRAARIKAVPTELDRFLKAGGFIPGQVEKLADVPATHPVTEEEAAIFAEAVDSYPMLRVQPREAASRNVPEGVEYLFVAKSLPIPGMSDSGAMMKIYVLAEEGQAPVFTQVVR